MSRITMSRDGVPRMDIRVTHRIGFSELVDALAMACVDEYDWREEFPENPSPSWILARAREVYATRGSESMGYWSEKAEDDADEIERWAEAAVNGAFPDLRPSSR